MSSADNKEKAMQLYESGFGSLAKVAESLGEKKNTVESWKKRAKKDGEEWVKISARKKEGECTQSKELEKIAKIKKKKVKDIEDKLTEKQRLFAHYYIQSFNVTQSATKAGYSTKTAYEIGSATLKNVRVRELILELREGFNEELHLDANRILNRHATIAMSDIKDFVDYGMKECEIMEPVDEKDGKIIYEKKIIERFEVNFKDSNLTDGTLVKKVKMGKFGLEFELEDRSKSLEFLTKYMGLDKVENDIEKEDNLIEIVGV